MNICIIDENDLNLTQLTVAISGKHPTNSSVKKKQRYIPQVRPPAARHKMAASFRHGTTKKHREKMAVSTRTIARGQKGGSKKQRAAHS